MTRRRSSRAAVALALVIFLCGLPGLALATRALQSTEIFSPASGHAQVIAQGVATLPAQAAWRAVFYSIDPANAAPLPPGGPGFVLVDTGGISVGAGDDAAMLAPAEAVFRAAGPISLTPVDERSVGLFTLDLVAPEAAGDAAGGIPVYASQPFASPPGARDLDLVRDLLQPGESTTVIGGEAPVLVVVTLGSISVEATDGTAAPLRVGEAGTFSGDIVITGDGQAPATFVAAVIGRESPVAGVAAAPNATPQGTVAPAQDQTPAATAAPEPIGSVQSTVYACPPAVSPPQASPGRCLPDPAAVAVTLAAREGSSLRDLGPASERQGLPTWAGLPAGEYLLQASGFKEGFSRFFVRGLDGSDGGGENGYGVAEGGYLIPISEDAADYSLEIYAFGAGADTTPAAQATQVPATQAAETPAAQPAETPTAQATGSSSVILIETEVPGAPTATPRSPAIATVPPRATATPRATEPPLVTSTAVARPRQGTISLRVWGCPDSADTFDPARCALAVEGFNVWLVSSEGETIGLDAATIAPDGTLSWERLPLGNYLFQQPLLLPGTATYYIPNLPLADDGSGYVIAITADQPVAAVDVFNLAPEAAPTVAPTGIDTDSDGLPDADETGTFGTDPTNADSDLDGVSDGQEVAAGTNPLVADATAPVDSDADGLTDADEAALGTDPLVADSDADGWLDGDEVTLGTSPVDPASAPVG